jgi:hypothetical protein
MKNNEKPSRESSLKGRTNPPAETNTNRLRTRLLLLGAVMAMILLSGCASARVQGDADPWQYNSDNGQYFRS